MTNCDDPHGLQEYTTIDISGICSVSIKVQLETFQQRGQMVNVKFSCRVSRVTFDANTLSDVPVHVHPIP